MTKAVGEFLRLPRIRLLKADDGATAIEYGLLAALIAAMILVGLTAIGSNLNAQLSQLGSAIGAAQSGSPAGGNGNGYGKGGKCCEGPDVQIQSSCNAARDQAGSSTS